MILTNSIFKAFLECPSAAMAQYAGRVNGNAKFVPLYRRKQTAAMAAGSLVDAIVTRGYDFGDKTSLMSALASSYGDGSESVDMLTTKKGEWNADAQKAIAAAQRLMREPLAQQIIDKAITQSRIRFEVSSGVFWEGDVDIISELCGELWILDLKSPGNTSDGWIVSGGRNVKVPWYDAWQYWFQLAGYRYGIEHDATLDGEPIHPAWDMMRIRQGLLYATREEVPEIGLVEFTDESEQWHDVVLSKLPAIRAIVNGDVDAPCCGKCDWCKMRKTLTLPSGDAGFPAFDDMYGITYKE